MNTVSLFHYLLTLIIWFNESLFLIILNSLFTDSLHLASVFTHGFIQLFFNVMNWIKIINQVWLGLFSKHRFSEPTKFIFESVFGIWRPPTRSYHLVLKLFVATSNQKSGSKIVCIFSVILILKRIIT